MTVSNHLGLLAATVISITELVFLGSRGSSVHTFRNDDDERQGRVGSCSLSVLVFEVQALSYPVSMATEYDVPFIDGTCERLGTHPRSQCRHTTEWTHGHTQTCKPVLLTRLAGQQPSMF